MIKRKEFFVVESDPISYDLIFPNNYKKLSKRYPSLLSDENIKKATTRFGTKKKNLVLVPNKRGGNRKISWRYDGDFYELTQETAVMMDGASTPINIGQIGGFTPNLMRAWYVHDALYAIFHKVPRKTCDRIFICFAEADGTKRGARMLMMTALRMFGWKARKMKSRDHWNYGRMTLLINGRRIDE